VSRGLTLEGAAADHRSEVAAAAAAFAAVPDDAWEHPLGEGKWSPAETAQHLIVVFEKLTGQLRGGPRVRYLVPWWKRVLFRRLFLRRMLDGTWYPRKIKGPPESRPVPPFPARSEAPLRLRAAADAFETAIREGHARRAGCVAHPYLGRLEPADGLRFFSRHTRHHREQMERRLARTETKEEAT
jgi:hypothetical protein